ncbi:MAG TPA: anthrone oxygenase family protein [Rubrobacter sp.]|nr:anthrone oxygenase family protein [Rubrobacter sp.]
MTRRLPLGGSIRDLILACAVLATGLMAGVFYAYAVSVNLGLAEQPDASYVATMNEINEKIQNPLFFPSFFGAAVLPIAALFAHLPRRRSGRFRLIVLACVLYVGGSFLVTVLANVPLNEELARVATDAPASELARARAAYEEPWNLWNGVRSLFSVAAFAALIGACLMREYPRTP